MRAHITTAGPGRATDEQFDDHDPREDAKDREGRARLTWPSATPRPSQSRRPSGTVASPKPIRDPSG